MPVSQTQRRRFRIAGSSCGRVRGFTLVELLVVIGIIAVLIGILIPTLSRARDVANLTKCRANLSQIGLALRMYANDNKDHMPDPVACGDAPNCVFAYAYRRGVNEPDPANPSVVETLGLPNLLYRYKYLPNAQIWVCPARGGRMSTLSELNSYCWNISTTTSAYTSKQRNTPPMVNGVRSEKDWWVVQDNVFYAIKATNVASTSSSVTPTNPFSPTTPTSLNFWYMPHQFKVKRVNSYDNAARQGSTNVLFLDGSTGYFVYTTTSRFAPAEVVRGQ